MTLCRQTTTQSSVSSEHFHHHPISHHFVLSFVLLLSSTSSENFVLIILFSPSSSYHPLPPHQYVLSLTAPHDCVFSFLFLAPGFPLQISLTFSRIPNQIPSSLNLTIFLVPKGNRLSNTSAPSIGGDLAPSLGGRKNFADQCSE